MNVLIRHSVLSGRNIQACLRKINLKHADTTTKLCRRYGVAAAASASNTTSEFVKPGMYYNTLLVLISIIYTMDLTN